MPLACRLTAIGIELGVGGKMSGNEEGCVGSFFVSGSRWGGGVGLCKETYIDDVRLERWKRRSHHVGNLRVGCVWEVM